MDNIIAWNNKKLQIRWRRIKGHLGETEIRIGETELLGFLAVAMSYELSGSG